MKKKALIITILLFFSMIFIAKAEWIIDDRWEIDPRWNIAQTSEYTLTINSYPTNVIFYLNGTSKTTPYSSLKTEDNYNTTFPTSITIESIVWTFWYWEDDTTNTNPQRIITLDEDTSLRGIYTTTGKAQLGEGVFTSGMDLVFIKDNITPYGQILLDTSVWENHGFIYPKAEGAYLNETYVH